MINLIIIQEFYSLSIQFWYVIPTLKWKKWEHSKVGFLNPE